MKIIWYGHSCFQFFTGDGSAVFDPFSPNSVPGFSLPQLTADKVFCSHGHHDHNYYDGVVLSGNKPSFKVNQIPCFHDKCGGLMRGDNLVTVISADNLRIAHFGDIGHLLSDKLIYDIGTVDIAMIPVGGYYTVGPDEAKEICSSVGAKVIIPMHYRGNGFGYDKIGTVEPFLNLFDRKIITRLLSLELEISTAIDKRVIVFR